MKGLLVVCVVVIVLGGLFGPPLRIRSHRGAEAPKTEEEKAAVKVFRAFAGALTRDDPAAACRHATEAAYEQLQCGHSPRVPPQLADLRVAGPVGVLVDPAEYGPGDYAVSAPVEAPPPTDSRHLILFMDEDDDEWRVVKAKHGLYDDGL